MANYKNIDDIFEDEFFKEYFLQEEKNKINKTVDIDIADFKEIISFYEINGREPSPEKKLGKERTLYNRLNGIRNDKEKKKKLKFFDVYNFLGEVKNLNLEDEFSKKINKLRTKAKIEEISVEYSSIDDVLSDFDDLEINDSSLEDEMRILLDFLHILVLR